MNKLENFPKNVDELIHLILITAIDKPDVEEYVFKGWSGRKRPEGRHLTYFPIGSKSFRPARKAIDNEDGKFKVFQFREDTIQLDVWGDGALAYLSDVYLWLRTQRVNDLCRRLNCSIVEMQDIQNLSGFDKKSNYKERGHSKIVLRYVVETVDDVGVIDNAEIAVISDGEIEDHGFIKAFVSDDKKVLNIFIDEERIKKQEEVNNKYSKLAKLKRIFKGVIGNGKT